MRRIPLLVLAATLACTSEVAPKNPYDPATPLPLQAKARITGSVETGAGAPFAQLEIYLRKNGTLSGAFTTDAAGAFVFDALTPGSYLVEAQAPGFAPVSVPLVLAPGADVDLGALAMSPLGGADTGFLRGSAVLGRKVAGPGGGYELDPTADHGGILVESVGTPYAAVTTSTGDYELALPPGTHTLRVSHPSYIAQELPSLEVSLGVVSPVVVVVLATNPAKVSGQVLGELPGGGTGPLAFATVTLEGTSATGVTNAAGQFTLDQLAPGSYLLRVLMDGYATAAVPVLNLVGGETRVLSDPLALSLERGAIRGQVALADAADASGVVVEVTGSGRAVVTGADGRYAFDALVAGSYEVRARRDGYAQQVVSGLAVTAGAAVDVPLVTLTRQGGTVAIGEGAVTRSRSITLAMGAPSAASWRASEDPTFQDAALGDLATTRRPYRGPGSSEPWQLTDRDGERIVYVVFHDALDGASAPASAAIVLDRVAPVAPSVIIDADAPFTRFAAVGLALSAQDLPSTAPGAGPAVSGLARMEIANNSAFTEAQQYDFNLAQPWTLTDLGGAPVVDGTKGVWVRFYDRAGNQSAPAHDLITLDRKEPQAPTIALSGGADVPAGTTGSPLVTATLSATDENEGAGKQDLQIRLSNAMGFAGATWQPFAATVSWLLPPGDGAKRVYAQFMDPAGNVSAVADAGITLAGTAPSAGSLTVANGAAATRLQVVTVQPSAVGATEMRLFVNGQPATGWIPYATGGTVDLGPAPDEATRLVSVSFRNSAGVEGGGASASIVFDQRAPTAPAVTINGGAAYASDPTVTLTLGAVDAPAAAGGYAAGLDTVELSQDDQFTSPTILPYTTSAPWTFLGLEGSKTVYARFRDRAGNLSATVSAAVIYDHTAPANPTITLAGNAGAPANTTGTPVVTASLSATDLNDGGPARPNLQMRLSADLGFAGASWEPFQAAIAWTLPGADGAKTVYVQFRDAAGNVSQAASATITLASTPPAGGSIVVEGGAAATRKTSVAAAITASGATRMLVSVNGVPQAAGWIPYGPAATVDLTGAPDEATATVSVAFRNAGGLEGGGASTAILVDRRAPSAGAVAINAGAPFTGPLAVTLSLSALDAPLAAGGVASGLDSVEVSNDAFATSTAVPMVASLSWTLAAGPDGARTVSARFKDKAGNVSAATTATITVDNTAPANPTISLSGGAVAKSGYTGSPVVTATLSATDLNDGGAARPNLQMRLSSDSGFAGASWQAFSSSASVSLPGGDGPKTVYAQFRDAVGNTSATASAGITLAASPPSNGSISAAAATSLSTVTATLAASNADRMLISVNGVPQAAGWIPYATSATVDLGANPDEATRGLSVLFRNAGGVDGAAASTSIVMDRTPPTVTAGSVVVNGGAAFTGSLGVTVALVASDGPVAGTAASGLAYVELSNDGTTFTRLPWASSVAWTLPDVADGTRTVTVRVVDRAGNVSGVASDTIVLDRTGPSGTSISLVGNVSAKAGYTGTPVVAATVAATDPSEGTGKSSLQVRLGNDSNFSGSNWQPYATSLSWVLPVGDGPKDVWVQFKDGVGNVSTPIFATINLMETPPSAGTIAVAGGAAVTRLTSVPATLSAVNPDRMLIYVNGVAQPGGWVAYNAAASVDLSGVPTESTATVSVVFRNAGGVDGGDALTSILVDRTAPGAPSVAINGGASYAGSAAVALALSASDGPTTGAVSSGLATVDVSNDAFATFQSFPYAASLPWTLLPGPPGGSDGARTVSVRFRDKAGNLSATPNASASITLDTTKPSAATIALTGNAEAQPGYTGTPVVTAAVAAFDASGGAGNANLQVRLSNDSSFAGSTWQAYSTALSWVLALGDGPKTVWVQFKDPAGNVSDGVSGSIQLLTTPPSSGSIVLAGGAAATPLSSVPASIRATGATKMRLSVDGQQQAPGWVDYATGATVALGTTPAEATRLVTVTFRNAGGVEGGAASASIRYDATAPQAGGLAVVGTLGNGSPSGTYTTTPAVLLRVTPPGADEVEMAVTQAASAATLCSGAFATPLWQPVSRSASLVLTGADGPKRTCVVFRDAAGNFSAATAATADITLDTTAPSNPSFVNLVSTTQNGTTAPTSGTPVVTASTDAGSGGVTYQCTGGVGAAYGASWVDCGTLTTLPSAYALAANAQSTLGVRARDAAYNYSPGSFVQIIHDDVKPMPPNVTGLQTTRDSLSITWDASPDADVASYRVHYGNFAGDFSGTGAAQGPSPVTVTATGLASQGFVLTGLTTSYPYYVAVEAVDRAGNLSGPSGQRFAQPNDANPRLLSTYGGQQRSVGVRTWAAGGRTFAYVLQNQGVVQLDVTAENALPSVTGRASLPNFVPDATAPVAVFDCSRTNRVGTVLTGHCVVAAGSTLEGDYRGDGDTYRAPAPVVFFPVNPGGAGTILTVLPARPHRVVMATVGGKPVLLTVERSGVKAFDMTVVKAPRLLASAPLDVQTVSVAGEAWGVGGQALLVYAPIRTGTLPNYPPTLYEFDLANVWSGSFTKRDHGWLYDPGGNLMGWTVEPIVPIIGDNQFYMAWNDASGTWIGEWSPGTDTPWDWQQLSNPLAGDPDNRPIAGVAGNMRVYVFTDQPPAMSDPSSGPYLYQVYSDGGLVVTGSSGPLQTEAQSAALAVYAATGTTDTEHLFAVDRDFSSNYTVQRWHVDDATGAITYNANSFREVSPTWFAESDRFVFVAETDRIYTLDVSNPLFPKVVSTYSASAGFTKLQVHGRHLYALSPAGVHILRMGGDGALASVGLASVPMGYNLTDFVVRGRYLYLAMGWIRVYDVSTPAAPVYWAVTAASVGCGAIDARPAVTGGTTYEAIIYCGITGDYSNPDRFQTFTFNGGAPTALSGAITLPNDNGYWHPTHVTVRGTTAVVTNTLGSHVVDVSTPGSPYVTSNVLPVSGPVLFQGGYVVGLGKSGAASGPDFLQQLNGAVDGTLLFSTCGVDSGGHGSLASSNGVYYASCQRNGVSVFAAPAQGGGSLLLRADVSQTWVGQGNALATDGVYSYLAGPEYPSEAGRLYSVDGRYNPTATPQNPYYSTGNATPGGSSANWFISQDGVLQSFEAANSVWSLAIRSLVPSPVYATWPAKGSYAVPAVVGTPNGPWNTQPVSDGEIAWVSRNNYLESYDLRGTPAYRNQLNVGAAMGALALSRDRLYAGVATSGLIRIYDTSAGTYGAATSLTVSGGVTGITGLAAHGQYLFVTYQTNRVDPYGLAVIRLGANRDGNLATEVARFPSQVPLGAPTVAGDTLYVTRDRGLATYDLTPLWQDAVPPVLAGTTVSTEPSAGVPRFVIDGPWGYLVGNTFRAFDLRQ